MKLLASLLALVTVGLLHAATETKPVLPVISIQQVHTEDATTYAMWMARNNEAAKAKLGVEKYYRIYQGQAAGEDAGVVFAVVAADSFVTLTKNAALLADEPALVESRAHLNAIRETRSVITLKAVRYDGSNAGAHLYNTWALINDEAAYLKALGELRVLFDSHDMKEIKINAFRVIAGRKDASHLVSLNAPTAEKRAAMLDAITTESWMSDWLASLAKVRTVVRNGTYREITR